MIGVSANNPVFRSVMGGNPLPKIAHASFLALLILLSACTSSNRIPNPDQEQDLASFRVTDVSGVAVHQDSRTASTTRRVAVQFFALVTSAATGLPTNQGERFFVYEGGTLITTAITTGRSMIQWQQDFVVEEGAFGQFRLFNFSIVGDNPHQGTRTIRVQVDPTKTGSTAVIEVTNGNLRAPTPIETPSPALLANGEIDTNPNPGFKVDRVEYQNIQWHQNSIARATGKPTAFDLTLRVCLLTDATGTPRLRPGQLFKVQGFGIGLEDPLLRTERTDVEGCLLVLNRFVNFQHFSQERYFEQKIKICGENDLVRRACIEHTLYINPWEAQGSGSRMIYGQGRTSADGGESVPNRSPVQFLDNAVSNFSPRPARAIIRGYLMNFVGRRFQLNDDLDISSQRYYDLVLEPQIERQTMNDGMRTETLQNGEFTLELLVLKTHGEAIGAHPIRNDQNRQQALEDLLCFHRETIYDQPLIAADRERCYARAYVDYVRRDVRVENGRIFVSGLPINFNDIRLIFSRSLLYIQLTPKENEFNSGLVPNTFVGTIFPLEEVSSRLLHSQREGAFYILDNVEDNDPIRADLEQLERIIVDRTEELTDDSRRFLERLAQNMPSSQERARTFIQDQVAAANQAPRVNTPGERHYADGSSAEIESRRIVFRGVRDFLRADSLATILEAYRKHRTSLRRNIEFHNDPRNALEQALPRPLRIYKSVNNLKLPEELPAASRPDRLNSEVRDVLLRGIVHRRQRPNRSSEVEATLPPTPEVQAALGQACEVIHGNLSRDDSDREMREFARLQYEALVERYDAQRRLLCQLRSIVISRAYDSTNLNLAELDSNCSDPRPACVRGRPNSGPNPNRSLGWLSRLAVNTLGRNEAATAPDVCRPSGTGISERESQVIQAVVSGDRNLFQSLWSGGLSAQMGIIETLAQQYFSITPTNAVRQEVIRRNTQGPDTRPEDDLLHPENILENPRRFDLTDARIRSRYPMLIATPKVERCKRDPYRYLRLEHLEFVTQVLERPRNTNAGSTNITVSTSIGISYADSEADTWGTSRSNYLGIGAEVGMGTSANAQIGVQFLGVGLTASEKLDSGTKASVYGSQSWFLTEARTRSRGEDNGFHESSGRTLNAEEITFQFRAKVRNCIGIQERNPLVTSSLREMAGGILLCQPQDEERRIEETWYYIYLFFRNNFSPMHDAAGDMVMRPWTALIRGKEQFDSFKEYIQAQTQSHGLRLERGFMGSPDSVMQASFGHFEGYRLTRDLPGLIRTRELLPPPTAAAPRRVGGGTTAQPPRLVTQQRGGPVR